MLAKHTYRAPLGVRRTLASLSGWIKGPVIHANNVEGVTPISIDVACWYCQKWYDQQATDYLCASETSTNKEAISYAATSSM